MLRNADTHTRPRFCACHSQVVTVALVLELAGGGELFDYIMLTGRLSELAARTYFTQVCSLLLEL